MSFSSLKPGPKTNSLGSLLATGEIWLGSSSATTSSSTSQLSPNFRQQHPVVPIGIPEIDSVLPYGGLPLGTLHEFFSPGLEGVTELPLTIPSIITRKILEQSNVQHSSAWNRDEKRAFKSDGESSSPFSFVWIGKRCWPTPFLLEKSSLSQCIFIDPPSSELLIWSMETALRSPSVVCVVADCPSISLTTFRKLQFAARSSGATALLLRHEKDAEKPSCAYSQWNLTPSPSSQELPAWELKLIKVKGGMPNGSSWIVCAESSYEQREKVSICLLPKLVDRCNEKGAPEQGSQPTTRRYGT